MPELWTPKTNGAKLQQSDFTFDKKRDVYMFQEVKKGILLTWILRGRVSGLAPERRNIGSASLSAYTII